MACLSEAFRSPLVYFADTESFQVEGILGALLSIEDIGKTRALMRLSSYEKVQPDVSSFQY
jgi:hypothetical protein